MGRLLSIIAGVWIGWRASDTVGLALGHVLFGAFIVTLITMTFWLKALLRPSPESVAEAMLPMPLALYVRAGKAVLRGEISRTELLWQYLRIFALSSVSIATVAILTRLAKGLFG